MRRDEIDKKKTLRSINIKINRNQKNEDQTQNKYKLEDTTEFLKAWHKYEGLEEKKKGRRKKTYRRPTCPTRHLKSCATTLRFR